MPGYLEKQEGLSPPYSLTVYSPHHGVDPAGPDYNSRMTSSTMFPHDAVQNGIHRDYTAHGNVTYNPAMTANYDYSMAANSGAIGTAAEIRQSQRKPPKRKRIISFDQRKAANVRERRRMLNLNDSFDLLRNSLPTFSYEKKLSRIETLRLALIYIAFMTDILNGANPKEVKLFTGRVPNYSVKKNGRMAKMIGDGAPRDVEFLPT